LGDMLGFIFQHHGSHLEWYNGNNNDILHMGHGYDMGLSIFIAWIDLRWVGTKHFAGVKEGTHPPAIEHRRWKFSLYIL
jgi:hypothetical protein